MRPSPRPGSPSPDTGEVLFSVADDSRAYVVPFDGAARVFEATDFGPKQRWVGGRPVEALHSVLLSAWGGAQDAFALYSLDDGSVTPVLTGEDCRVRVLHGGEAVFLCADGRFSLADLPGPALAAEPLVGFTPAGARADAVLPFEWLGLPWYNFFFVNESGAGYSQVLYQADTKEAIALGEGGAHISAWASLPARSD